MLRITFISLLVATVVYGSSHSEAPGTASSPRSDLTDVYMFRSYTEGGARDDYVSLLANINPFQQTFGGPNYSPMASDFVYNFHIDNTGDAVEDITFQFIVGARFNGEFDAARNIHEGIRIPVGPKMIKVPLAHVGVINANNEASVLNYWEEYRMRVFNGRADENNMIDEGPFATRVGDGAEKLRKPFDYAGEKSFGGAGKYEDYARTFVHDVNIPGCAFPGKVFVGQRAEPFYVNLGNIFDLLNFSPAPATEVLGADSSSFNMLKNSAVTTLGIEVHKSCLVGSSGSTIGGWASVQHLKHVGPEHAHKATAQKTRLGNPLVNEVLIGLTDKDDYGKRHPSQDSQYSDYLDYPTIPEIVELLFGDAVRGVLNAPNAGSLAPQFYPRVDISTVLFKGVPGVTIRDGEPQADILRLNLDVPPTRRADQLSMAIIDNEAPLTDTAGYPNGRRPGDDVVDIVLRVAMGRLCHPPFDGALSICTPAQAPAGNLHITDRAPISASDFQDGFPWFNTPLAGNKIRN